MQGGEAVFNVQVWKLTANGKDDGFQHDLISWSNLELLLVNKDSNISILEIPADELEIYDRLGFAITRLDMDEIRDPVGGYAVDLFPVGEE